MRNDIVHLHSHTHYSLLDGMSQVKDLVSIAKKNNQRALAITDHGVMLGVVEHYKECMAQGIKPIIGNEMYMSLNKMTDKDKENKSYYHLIVLAKNLEGYRNLLYLTTEANLTGYYYKPKIDHNILAERSNGLIVLSACLSGEVAEALKVDDYQKAKDIASWYKSVFGDDYYLEIQDHGIDLQTKVNRGVLQIAKELGIKTVCTNDNHYSCQNDHEAHEILLCVQTKAKLSDEKRFRFDSDQHYLKSADEMAYTFHEVPESLRNTLEVSEKCNLEIPFGRLSFPKLKFIPEDQSASDFLAEQCWKGLYERYGIVSSEVIDRLNYELSVVNKTGFAEYILFVWDFVKYARSKGILCQPRGSAAGSIILYCLNISTIDPLAHNLTFERFLNPERIQMPDIDMDFADNRREEVIQYITEEYGVGHVAQIVTINKMLARGSIRDVGRVLDYPIPEVDKIAKLIPTIPVGVTIDKALQSVKELRDLYNSDATSKKIIDVAKTLEGTAKSAGVHAAGVVVSDEPLVNHVPLQYGKGDKSNSIVSQYEMHALEDIGLLKMDFLGLSTLTLVERALDLIEERHGKRIDIYNDIPDDDTDTFRMLCDGHTVGIFQLEGSNMTKLIKEFKPNNVRHLADIVALYRPGPLAHISDYIDVKNGKKKVSYAHPILENILKDTYGTYCYQEQIMRIVQDVAGYSLGQADILRKAIGKKIPEEMHKEKGNFLIGAKNNNISSATAEEIWEQIEPHAGYSFNKSHAYCYGYLSLITAYLKCHYPLEFMTAMLNTERGNIDKVTIAIGECHRLGIEILSPDVNLSDVEFTIEGNKIRYGLSALQQVEDAANILVNHRKKYGEFTSFDNIGDRIHDRKMTKKVYEQLIKSGALIQFGSKEEQLAMLDGRIKSWSKTNKAEDAGQQSFFDMVERGSTFTDVERVTSQVLAMWEKEALGLFLTNHPYLYASKYLENVVSMNLSDLKDCADGTKCTISGAAITIKKIVTKKNDSMAVLTLEDLYGNIEVVIFPRLYGSISNILREDAILIITGKTSTKTYGGEDMVQVIAENVKIWNGPDDTPDVLVPTYDISYENFSAQENKTGVSLLNQIVRAKMNA